MKNLSIFAIACLSLVGCKKSTDGNKGVITEENVQTKVIKKDGKIDSTSTVTTTRILDGKKYVEHSVSYKATDGKRVKVTFTDSEKDDILTLETNNKRLQFYAKGNASKEDIYENGTAKAVVKGDSIIVEQDGNTIQLVKDK